MNSIIYINEIEVILLALSLITIFFLALKNIKSVKTSIIITIFLIPILYLSVEGTTQFTGTDGTSTIQELVNIKHSTMRAWYDTANRTSDAVIGTSLALFQKYIYLGVKTNVSQLKMLAKAFHWLLGFLIIIVIYILIDKYYIFAEEQRVSYFIIYFYSILLLPLNILALKVITYDLLSMLLGILTLVLLLIALKKASSRYALIGVVVGTLAAQEKLIASPVLLCSFIVFTYLKLNESSENFYLRSFYYSFYSLYIAFLTSLITFLIVAMVAREGYIPKIDFDSVITPFIIYLIPIIRLLKGGHFATINPPPGYLLLLFNGIIISTISLLAFKIKPWLTNLFFPFIKRNMRRANLIAIFLVLLIGILGTYVVNVFLDPFYPVPKGYYFPPYSFNSIPVFTLHFDVKTLVEHMFSYIGFSYAVFVNAIPSIYFILLFFSYFYNKKQFLVEWKIILLIMWVVPLLYAITSVPVVVGRYFNLFIFLVILVAGLEFNQLVNSYHNVKKWIVVGLFLIFLIGEILPFRPIFADFRPIWNNYSEEFNKNPVAGKLVPSSSGSGGGEGTFLLSKKIAAGIAKGEITNTNDIHIYHYHGQWINSSNFITSSYYPVDVELTTRILKTLRFTKSDYYIVDRTGLSLQRGFFFKDVEPTFIISYRGFVQAWVYRGDHIKLRLEKMVHN